MHEKLNINQQPVEDRPREKLITHGADSLSKAAVADMLEKALDICMFTEKKLTITGRDTGCTCSEFGDYVMETVKKLSK